MEPVNSTTFIKKPVTHGKREEALFEAREILLNRLFLGHYDERRHVGPLKEYRDVVTVSPAETELIMDLDKILKNLSRFCEAKWVGITGPEIEGAPSGHCLWVKLTNIPFGCFWFQIKQIRCEYGEISLRLKCIRSFRAQDYENTKKVTTITKVQKDIDKPSLDKSEDYSFEFDPADKLNALYGQMNDAVRQVTPHLTLKNFVLVGKFTLAVAFVFASAILTSVRYLGDYALRLIRELTLLLRALTPVFLQAIDFLTKTVGGLFILIALMFRGRFNGPQQMENQFQFRDRHPRLLQIKATPERNSLVTNTSSVVPTTDWRERNKNLKMQLGTETKVL